MKIEQTLAVESEKKPKHKKSAIKFLHAPKNTNNNICILLQIFCFFNLFCTLAS